MSNQSPLLERLAAIREANKAAALAANPSPLSELKSSHTLYTFLQLYNKAERECYINYMEGAKYLLGYLTHGFTVPLDLEVEKYPEILDETYKIPSLLCSYEINELARVLAQSTSFYGTEFNKYHKAIILTTLTLFNEGKLK